MSRTVISVVILCLLSSPVWAATFIVPDDKELVEKSTAIVQGVVVDRTSRTQTSGA